MFGLIQKIFFVLISNIVNGPNHTKCVLLSSSECITPNALINLHSNEYSHEFQYYPFGVKLDRCVGSCNTLNDLSDKLCVPNKKQDLNLSVFSMITGINVNLMEENVIQINDGITINVDVKAKNFMYVKNNIFGIILHAVANMEDI